MKYSLEGGAMRPIKAREVVELVFWTIVGFMDICLIVWFVAIVNMWIKI